MSHTWAGNQQQREVMGNEVREGVSTPVRVPSGGHRREPQRSDS